MPRPTAPRVDAADLDARALDLRRSGATYRQIAQQLGISPATAFKRVTRGLDRTRREPADALRELEAERLDQLQIAVTRVLHRQHVIVQGGKIVKDDNDQPLIDDGPTLAAANSLVRVQESRRKLLGLDEQAPAEQVVKVQVELLLTLLQKSLLTVFPDDQVRFAMAMDAAIAELRRIATTEAGDMPELEAGP